MAFAMTMHIVQTPSGALIVLVIPTIPEMVSAAILFVPTVILTLFVTTITHVNVYQVTQVMV